MNSVCDRFGMVLRQRRQELKWSQERLAGKVDVNRSYLGEIEREYAVPSLTVLDKLARALEINLSILLARCEQRRRS